jgi:hypothetical protein
MALKFVLGTEPFCFCRFALSADPFDDAEAFHLAQMWRPERGRGRVRGNLVRADLDPRIDSKSKLWDSSEDGCTASGTSALVQAQGRSPL